MVPEADCPDASFAAGAVLNFERDADPISDPATLNVSLTTD
jgi:hypothetical protein